MIRRQTSGSVSLVGAGPGDPGLLTLKGMKRLQDAEVVIHDHLVSAAILSFVPPTAERVYVGKWAGESLKTQEEIGELLVSYASRGLRVVRLKGGDVFLFGRGGEESSRLREAGIPYEIVPGVSSALAVPAYAGIPVTDRRIASSLVVVTGHEGTDLHKTRVDWERLASAGDTLVILMGTRKVQEITKQLVRFGKSPDTPAAMIFWGTTGRQETCVATLGNLAEKAAGMKPPTVIVIGEVVSLRKSISWFEKGPLFGVSVLNTRPSSRSGNLTRQLAGLGALVSHFPLLACTAVEQSRERFMHALSETDWLVATSAHAAETMHGWGVELPRRVRLAVVGSASAEVFESCGYSADLIATERNAKGLCHQLLNDYPDVVGQKVLFAAGSRGLSTVPDVLAEAGVAVDSHIVYETMPAAGEALDDLIAVLAEQQVKLGVITSPLSAETWASVEETRRIPVVAISAGVSAILEGLGCRVAGIAEQPGDEGLIEALVAAAMDLGNTE